METWTMMETWTIKVTYPQLLLLLSSVEAYSPSGVFFTEEEKEELIEIIKKAK
jgi:hypothetical protein